MEILKAWIYHHKIWFAPYLCEDWRLSVIEHLASNDWICFMKGWERDQTKNVEGRRAAWEKKDGILQSLKSVLCAFPCYMCKRALEIFLKYIYIKYIVLIHSIQFYSIIYFLLKLTCKWVVAMCNNVFLDMAWYMFTYYCRDLLFKGLLKLSVIIKTMKEHLRISN